MPRKHIRKTTTKYSKSQLKDAVAEVKSGRSCYSVAKQFGIPLETLRRNARSTVKRQGSGGMTVLTIEEEKAIVKAIFFASNAGFPIDRFDVKLMVKSYLDKFGKVTRFTDNKPGPEWMRLFEKRYPELGKKKAELLTISRVKSLTNEVLNQFFFMYEKLLDDSGLKDSPNRIFNLDETGLNTNPLSQKVFTKRGSKTTYLNSASCGKQSYSVLFCCSTSG